MSSAVTASSASSTSCGSSALPLEHLAPQAEHDRPLRALELEHEPALGEVARLLELVGGHRLRRQPPELLDDRRHRLVDPVDVDAGLRVERACVGVGVVVPKT